MHLSNQTATPRKDVYNEGLHGKGHICPYPVNSWMFDTWLHGYNDRWMVTPFRGRGIRFPRTRRIIPTT